MSKRTTRQLLGENLVATGGLDLKPRVKESMKFFLANIIESMNNPTDQGVEIYTSDDKAFIDNGISINASASYKYEESEAESSNNTSTNIVKLEMLSSPTAGDYRWEWCAEIQSTKTSRAVIVEFMAGGVVYNEVEYKPKDDDNYISIGGFRKFTHAGGQFDLSISWRMSSSGGANDKANIRRARIELKSL